MEVFQSTFFLPWLGVNEVAMHLHLRRFVKLQKFIPRACNTSITFPTVIHLSYLAQLNT